MFLCKFQIGTFHLQMLQRAWHKISVNTTATMISCHKDKVRVSSPAALLWLALLDYRKNLFILPFIDAMLDTLKEYLHYQTSTHFSTQLSITICVFGRPKLSKLSCGLRYDQDIIIVFLNDQKLKDKFINNIHINRINKSQKIISSLCNLIVLTMARWLDLIL